MHISTILGVALVPRNSKDPKGTEIESKGTQTNRHEKNGNVFWKIHPLSEELASIIHEKLSLLAWEACPASIDIHIYLTGKNCREL